MGASVNVSQNIGRSVVDAYTNMVLDQVASCSATLAQNQNIKISGIKSSGTVVISGINMDQQSVMTPSCASDLTSKQQTKEALTNLQAQLAKAVSHSTPLNVSGNASLNTSTMITSMLSNVSSESIQKCISKIFQKQGIDIQNVSGSNIKIGGFDMKQGSKDISKCVFDSVQEQVNDNKVLSALKQEAKSKSKMFSTTMFVVIGVVLAVIVIAGIIGFVVYKKSKDDQAAKERRLNQEMMMKGVSKKDVVSGGGGGGGGDMSSLAGTAAKLAMSSTPQGAALSMLL